MPKGGKSTALLCVLTDNYSSIHTYTRIPISVDYTVEVVFIAIFESDGKNVELFHALNGIPSVC